MNGIVIHVSDDVEAEETLRSEDEAFLEHTNPFRFIVSMDTRLVSLPAVHVFELLVALSAMERLRRICGAIGGLTKRQTCRFPRIAVESRGKLPTTFSFGVDRSIMALFY
jgi:hypothetical protein